MRAEGSLQMKKLRHHLEWLQLALGLSYYAVAWGHVISGLLASAGFGAAVASAFSPAMRFPLGLVAGLAFAGALRVATYRMDARRRALNSGLAIDHFESTYIVHENGDCELVRRIKATALQDDVAFFRDRFYWTGAGEITYGVDPPSYVPTDATAMAQPWASKHITFPRPLAKGVSAEFTIRAACRRTGAPAVRVLDKTIDEIYRGIVVLRVQLHAAAGFERHEYLTYRGEMPTRTHAVDGADRREHEWPIERPAILCRYSITWNYTDTPRRSPPGNEPVERAGLR